MSSRNVSICKRKRSKNIPRCIKTIQRSDKILTAVSLPVILNVNLRSIYNKVENLKTYIIENNVDLVCVSERWARKSQPIEDVIKMDNYTVICNTNLRRQIDGTPAIIVNSSKFIVDIPDITPPWGVEIVWCVLTLKNTTTSSLVKRLVVGSFYS